MRPAAGGRYRCADLRGRRGLRGGRGDRDRTGVDDDVVAVGAGNTLRGHLRTRRIRGRADGYGTAVADLVVAVAPEDADAGGRGLDRTMTIVIVVLVVGVGRVALRSGAARGSLHGDRAAIVDEIVAASARDADTLDVPIRGTAGGFSGGGNSRRGHRPRDGAGGYHPAASRT